MAHECEECGQMCFCDGEDHGMPQPNDCRHARACFEKDADEEEYDDECEDN
jgi:hypothetical protein